MHNTQNHIPFSLIVDIAEGRTSPDAGARAHLDACPTCSSDLRWMSRTLAALQAEAAEEPPARAVADVKALFRARRPQRAPRASPLAAMLRFDSARARPAFALRAGASAERQLLFSAGPYDIDLRIAPAGDRWVVSGQLLGNILDDRGHVEILSHADSDRAELSPESEFVLRPLRAGTYSLTISFAHGAAVTCNVELGA